MIDEALYARLSADAGISALVSDRVFPGQGDQMSAAPMVTFSRISATRWRATDGGCGLARTRFQVDAYATDYLTARTLAAAIRRCLDDWRDLDAGVQDCSIANEVDLDDTSATPKLYRSALDFMVVHTED